MAGKKGRSGGKRPGAGRPPNDKPAGPAPKPAEDPLAFLLGVMNDTAQDPQLRVKAAIAACQYTHQKKGEGGKKEKKGEAAKKVAESGRFKAPSAPRLVVNNT